MKEPARFIPVRLRASTRATVERVAALCWLSPSDLCAGVIATYLDRSLPHHADRWPMPDGEDLNLVLPVTVFRAAKAASDRLDITIGQLARFAIEAWAMSARTYERRLAS